MFSWNKYTLAQKFETTFDGWVGILQFYSKFESSADSFNKSFTETVHFDRRKKYLNPVLQLHYYLHKTMYSI